MRWEGRPLPSELAKTDRARIPVVYSSSYDITACGIEKVHPFDSCKYSRTFHMWLSHLGYTEEDCVAPSGLSLAEFRRAHSFWYMVALHYSVPLSMILELPPVMLLPGWMLRWRVLRPMALASHGSMLAVDLALRFGWAINLGGGFHHASRSFGHGFCALADISLAVKRALEAYPDRVRKVLIIDLDAHQGNGHEMDFLGDERVVVFDAFKPFIFPHDIAAMRKIDYRVDIETGDVGWAFLQDLGDTLARAMQEVQPDLVFYNAGTDILAGDPVAGLDISWESVKERDRLVFEACGAGLRGHGDFFERCGSRRVPIVMVLSGGYQQNNAQLIAESMIEMEERFGLLESAQPDETGRAGNRRE